MDPNLIIQPFPIHFNCNDYHVMLFFKKHPEYESIEAMINDRGEATPFIRLIITRLDGTQVDHINNKDTADMLKSKKMKREVHYTPIQYERTEKGGKTHIVLKFTSFKGENILFDFYALKTSDKYAGLIDPGGHSAHTSLPVMYPERTTLAGPKSKIAINGVEYGVPVKVWIPLFFKGMKGYYSEMFNIGVFRAGEERVKILRAPESLKAGEKWIYESANQILTYEIKSVRGNTLSISKEDEAITVEISDDSFKIKKISLYSPSKESETAGFSIEFTPPLPISPAAGYKRKAETGFSISIGKHTSLMIGTAKAEGENNTVRLTLSPSLPEWAAKRPVSTAIEERDGEFILSTGIEY